MNENQQQALKMALWLLAVASVITATSWNSLPLVVVAAVSYVIWQTVTGLDG